MARRTDTTTRPLSCKPHGCWHPPARHLPDLIFGRCGIGVRCGVGMTSYRRRRLGSTVGSEGAGYGPAGSQPEVPQKREIRVRVLAALRGCSSIGRAPLFLAEGPPVAGVAELGVGELQSPVVELGQPSCSAQEGRCAEHVRVCLHEVVDSPVRQLLPHPPASARRRAAPSGSLARGPVRAGGACGGRVVAVPWGIRQETRSR